jgi:hypothetical protein
MESHAPGVVLAGKYRLRERIGAGHNTVVYCAEHIDLRQLVAVKLLSGRHRDSPSVERFQRESRTYVRLGDPAVLRLLDMGHADDGTPFIVLEYIQGGTLADLLQRRSNLTIDEVVALGARMCRALAQVHEHNLVHGDVKPSNILLPDGDVRLAKLGDFGFVEQVDASTRLTRSGVVIGTPAYMSPEQVKAVSVEARPSANNQKLTGAIRIGSIVSLRQAPAELELQALRQHAAFLGASGSGKTSLALNVIEQAAERGIGVIMLDRKGDLAAYADAYCWSGADPDAQRVQRMNALRARLDIRTFTPGNPLGCSLRLRAVPADLARQPAHERAQLASFSAQALLSMAANKTEPAQLAILGKAIEVTAGLASGEPTLRDVISLVADQDESLLAEIGHLDPKHMRKLVDKLEAVRINNAVLLGSHDPPLVLRTPAATAPSSTSGSSTLRAASATVTSRSSTPRYPRAETGGRSLSTPTSIMSLFCHPRTTNISTTSTSSPSCAAVSSSGYARALPIPRRA